MKKNISKDFTVLLELIGFLLLLSLLTAFLYTMDWISSAFFILFTQLIGIGFYAVLGMAFLRLIAKRVMIFALIFAAVIFLMAIFVMNLPTKGCLYLIVKLFVFLGVIFIFKKKR